MTQYPDPPFLTIPFVTMFTIAGCDPAGVPEPKAPISRVLHGLTHTNSRKFYPSAIRLYNNLRFVPNTLPQYLCNIVSEIHMT